MSLADGKTCNTCRFWADSAGVPGSGPEMGGMYAYCHALPPTPGDPVSRWPYVRGDQWCGAHKPAPKEAPDGD